MTTSTNAAADPWYRHPWPWLLMAGPAIVVVAGFLTLGFAIQSFDGLVADDYYKEGKAINMTMHRDARAQQLAYRATLTMSSSNGRIALAFASAKPAAAELRLTVSHPTRGGLDREIVLSRGADGTYSAALPQLEQARWKIILDDSARDWRLTGEWSMNDQPIELGAR